MYGYHNRELLCRMFFLLSCFEFFYCSATFLEKDAVTAIRAPDVDIDLDFLFAPCTLVGADHT